MRDDRARLWRSFCFMKNFHSVITRIRELTARGKSNIMNIVHCGGGGLNTGITSKETILQVCRGIVASRGLSAVTMRTVADECHIALGTLYNYYANKDELLLATVEDIWKDIFHMKNDCLTEFSFPDYIKYIFECVQRGAENYPDFLTSHSVSIANSGREKAKSTMQHCFDHIKERMLAVLQADDKVSKTAFSSSFEKSDFVDFVLDSILLLLVQKKKSCEVLGEIIQRTIYI